jgi:hypothetical protein
VMVCDARGESRAGSQVNTAGYGMPCARCRIYYAANVSACPVCNGSERVSPIAKVASLQTAAHAPAESAGTVGRPGAQHEKFSDFAESKLPGSVVLSSEAVYERQQLNAETIADSSLEAAVGKNKSR